MVVLRGLAFRVALGRRPLVIGGWADHVERSQLLDCAQWHTVSRSRAFLAALTGRY